MRLNRSRPQQVQQQQRQRRAPSNAPQAPAPARTRRASQAPQPRPVKRVNVNRKIIPMGDHKQIRVEGVIFNGTPYINVRQYYSTTRDPEFKPTRKGLMIPLDKGHQVAVALGVVSRDGIPEEFTVINTED